MRINISDEIGKWDVSQLITDDSPVFDFEKIKANVRSRTIDIEKPKKDGKRLRLFAALAAAVVVCTVSVTVLAVTGVFSNIFDSHFQGDSSVLDVYDGGNVRFESDDPGLEGKLSGVTGDENAFFAAIELTKKDGSAFTDEGYTSLMSGYCSGTDDNNANCCINAVSVSGMNISFEGMAGGYDVQYTLSDDRRTMTMIFGINADSSDIQNGRLTLRNNYFTAYRVVRKLAEFEVNDQNAASEEESIRRANHLDVSDTYLSFNGKAWELLQIECRNYDLPFVMEMDMNYETKDSLRISLKSSNALQREPDDTAETTMTISDLGIYIKTKYPIDKELSGDELVAKLHIWSINTRSPETDKSKIIMSDGTVYYFCSISSSAGTAKTGNDRKYYFTEENFRFSDIPEPQTLNKLILIDKTKISKIIFNGEVIYQK